MAATIATEAPPSGVMCAPAEFAISERKPTSLNGNKCLEPIANLILITDLPMSRGMPSAQRGNLPVAADAAAMVLCLPIYPELQPQEQQRVIDIIKEA